MLGIEFRGCWVRSRYASTVLCSPSPQIFFTSFSLSRNYTNDKIGWLAMKIKPGCHTPLIPIGLLWWESNLLLKFTSDLLNWHLVGRAGGQLLRRRRGRQLMRPRPGRRGCRSWWSCRWRCCSCCSSSRTGLASTETRSGVRVPAGWGRPPDRTRRQSISNEKVFSPSVMRLHQT